MQKADAHTRVIERFIFVGHSAGFGPANLGRIDALHNGIGNELQLPANGLNKQGEFSDPGGSDPLMKEPVKRIFETNQRRAGILFHQLPFIDLNGIFKAKINSVADQCVADTYFVKPGNILFEEFQILQIKIVPGI